VVRIVNDDLVRHFSCGLQLLNFRFGLLHLWSFLARPVEFQQGHALRYTYCMYMQKMNIMNA
jgi:hypothetical protein